MAEKLLLTPEEAFEKLSVGRAKGFQMLGSGELPSIKIGRLRRVSVEALRIWVQQQTEAADTPTGLSKGNNGGNRD